MLKSCNQRLIIFYLITKHREGFHILLESFLKRFIFWRNALNNLMINCYENVLANQNYVAKPNSVWVADIASFKLDEHKKVNV